MLHAAPDTLRFRIENAEIGPSPFRFAYLEAYAEAERTWLRHEAEIVDTTHLTAAEAAQRIAVAVST